MSKKKRYAILVVCCLGAMAVIMVITAQAYPAINMAQIDDVWFTYAAIPIGLYIGVFLFVRTTLVAHGAWHSWLLAPPTAAVAALVIAAGPFVGWVIIVGGFVGFLISIIVLGFFFFLLSPVKATFSLVFAAAAAGLMTGFLVHVAARSLTMQTAFGPVARAELRAHCFGFASGACLFLLSYYLPRGKIRTKQLLLIWVILFAFTTVGRIAAGR